MATDTERLDLGKPDVLRDTWYDEIRRLRAALEWCSSVVWDGMDIDGGDFQDHMEGAGLLKEVPASPEFREEWDADTMMVWKWSDKVETNA